MAKRTPYPVLEHDHPYSVAANRIHALETENTELRKVNRSLRLLAIHGLLYRLDSLIKEELGREHPNAGRIQRWSTESSRLRVAYERIKSE